MDENNVSFQMFLNLLSFIALGSESQISVFKQCQSNAQMSGFYLFVFVFLLLLFFLGGGEHAQKPKFRDSRFFSGKKTS